MRENWPKNQNLEGEDSKSLDEPLGESKPEAKEPVLDAPSLAKYRETGQAVIDSHRKFFETYAQDISLSFQLSDKAPTAHIELESGKVVLATRWFAEKGIDEKQLTWTVCHELEHFRDLAADPERMLRNFDYIIEQAKKTGALIGAKLEKKFGQSDPDFINRGKKQRPIDPKKPGETMSPIEMGAYKIHHTFYNVLDDIYVNNTVARRASRYEPDEEGGKAVRKLYRETLFKESDYQKLPRHLQFVYSLLRDEMVKGEKAKISDEVAKALKQKIKFQGAEYTPEEIIAKFLKPKSGRDTKAGERYLVIQKTLEPIFAELLAKDIEDWEPKKPKNKSGKGDKSEKQQDGESQDDEEQDNQSEEGESGERDENKESGEDQGKPLNPFDADYQDFEENNPDTIAPQDLQDWLEKKQANDKTKAEEEKRKKAEESKSAEQKAREAQEKMDREWAEKNEISYDKVREFRQIEAEIEPYLQEHARLWQKIIYGSSRQIERNLEGHFQTGTELDLPKVIEEWPKIATGKLDETKVMKKMTSRETLVKMPELIRIRLVGDLSGSMDNEKRHVLKQCFMLIMLSIREFNTYLNQTRSQSKSKLEADTEAWGFGDSAKKIKPLRKETGIQDEQRDIINTISALNQSMGSTYDNWALEAIDQSLSDEDKKKILKKKIMEIVFEITDGGSSNATASRKAVDKLIGSDVITRAFQIGTVTKEETEIFNKVWNDGREEKLGEVVGPDIKNLLPAVANALEKYLGDIRL